MIPGGITKKYTAMKKLMLCLLGLTILRFSASASHNRTAEITYLQVDAYTIDCSLVTYTNAISTAASRDSLELQWGDGTSTWIHRVNGPDADNNSIPDGEILANNYQRNVYRAQHRYADWGTYTIALFDDNRQQGIVNLNPPNSDHIPMYVETEFVLGPELNHSPQLLQAPVDIAYAGRRFVHTPVAFDPDGDSTSYRLIRPQMMPDQDVPNYSFPNQVNGAPPSALVLDTETGLLVWEVPTWTGVYSIAYEITSHRNGQVRGRLIRDLIIIVQDGEWPLPSLDVAPPPGGIQSVEVGDTVRLELSANVEEFPFNQELVLSTRSGLDDFFQTRPSFDFTRVSDREGRASFTWIVEQEHVRGQPYDLVFRAQDGTELANYLVLRYRVEGIVSAQREPVVPDPIRIFPNPASDWLVVEGARTASYLIWDAGGRIVQRGRLEPGQPIGISGLVAGAYFLRVEGRGSQAFLKNGGVR